MPIPDLVRLLRRTRHAALTYVDQSAWWQRRHYARWLQQEPIYTGPPLPDGQVTPMTLGEALQQRDRVPTPYVLLAEPTEAVRRQAAAALWHHAEQQHCELVYADWDVLDANGLRRSPHFTPEYSPALLQQALYWGRVALVRRELLQRTASSRTTESALERLAHAATGVGRVPLILSHSREPVRWQARPPRSNATASIVICTRSPRLLTRCLTELQDTLREHDQVIVVAHQTGRETELATVAAQHHAHVVPYTGPFHFGLMNAAGVAAARGAVLVLLNDDVRPVSSDWITCLAGQAMQPNVGVTGALLEYPDGTIQHAGVLISRDQLPTHLSRRQEYSSWWPWLRLSREVTAVTGACLALRRDVWDALGGFDPAFPNNYNDADLCLRARQQGLSVVLCADARLIHDESATRASAVSQQERDLFRQRWSHLPAADPYFHPQLSASRERIELRPSGSPR